LLLSTLALETASGGEPADAPGALRLVRHADLVVLAIALPVFVVASLPILGYAVVAAVWIAQSAVQVALERRALRASVRRNAIAVLAGSLLARLWLVMLAVLVVGLAAGREVGLSAAVLTAVLFSFHLAGEAFFRLLSPPEPRA
jgi:hypothetical protein